MDHPKDHSLFGLGLPGVRFGRMVIFKNWKVFERKNLYNIRTMHLGKLFYTSFIMLKSKPYLFARFTWVYY